MILLITATGDSITYPSVLNLFFNLCSFFEKKKGRLLSQLPAFTSTYEKQPFVGVRIYTQILCHHFKSDFLTIDKLYYL